MSYITKEDFWHALNEPEPKITIDSHFKIYCWYNEEGLLHRDNDLPAQIWYRGDDYIISKVWYQNGELHRDNDLPAEIWYRENGNIREKSWYQNEKYHRIGGPAVIWYHEDGSIRKKDWYLNGEPFYEKEYWKKLKELGYE